MTDESRAVSGPVDAAGVTGGTCEGDRTGRLDRSPADEGSPGPAAERVFLFGLPASGEKGARIREAAAAMGVAAESIDPCDLGRSVQDLLDRPAREDGAAPSSSDTAQRPAPDSTADVAEFMLMDGFSDARLDQFLALLWECGAIVGCKCATTPANRGWTVAALMEEVAREHRVMEAYMGLAGLYRRAEQALASRGADRPAGDPAAPGDGLSAELGRAGDLLRSGREHDAREYEQARARLEAALAGEGAGDDGR